MHEEMSEQTKNSILGIMHTFLTLGKLEYRLVTHFVEYYGTPLNCGYGRYGLILSSYQALLDYVYLFDFELS